MIVASWGAVTDCGPVRKVNEDSLLAEPPVFVVADGMGGHAAGDVASRLAIGEFEELGKGGRLSVAETKAAVYRANKAIVEAVHRDAARAGMGTTVAGLAVVTAAGSEHWMVFNVGDCRVYRVLEEGVVQLTTDHSEAEELVATGKMTRAEARDYPRRNVVTRSLGTDPAPVIDSWVFPPEAADRFMICSDGLTDELDDQTIASCANAFADPQQLAQELVTRATAAGGKDNVTVIVVEGLIEVVPPGANDETGPRPAQGSLR